MNTPLHHVVVAIEKCAFKSLLTTAGQRTYDFHVVYYIKYIILELYMVHYIKYIILLLSILY